MTKPISAWITPMGYEPLLDAPYRPTTQLPLNELELNAAARQLADAMEYRSSLIAQAERTTPARFMPASLPSSPPRRLRLT